MRYYHVEERLRQRVREVYALACRLYPKFQDKPVPSVGFRYKGKSVGTAFYAANSVTLNVGQAVQSDAIERLTVPHEIAHLVAAHVYGEKGHGRYWRMVCIALGGDGKRCYNATERGVTVIPGRTVSQYLYRDSAGNEVWVGPVHHSRLQSRGETHNYRLRTAKGTRVTHHDYLGKSRVKV